MSGGGMSWWGAEGLRSSGLGVVLLLASLGPCSAQLDMHMTVGSISWARCTHWNPDAHFPMICSNPQPLEVAVTVEVTWSLAPHDERGGPALWTPGEATQDWVLLRANTKWNGQAKIAWRMQGADQSMDTMIPYNSGPYDVNGYAFRAYESPSEVTDLASPNVQTITGRFVFTIPFMMAGVYEVFFENCCRYTELLNIGADVYPAEVPWHLKTTIRVEDCVNASALSPKVSMPYTQIHMRRWSEVPGNWTSRRGFKLYAPADGEMLTTKVQSASGAVDQDISGEYYEMDYKIHINRDTAVTRGGPYTAYKRSDGEFAIVWFDSVSNYPQFQDTGAYATQASWVVVDGSFDAADREGRRPTTLPVILESIGGRWPPSHMAEGWNFVGPSYADGAIEMYVGGVKGVLAYDNGVRVQALFAPPPTDPGTTFGNLSYMLTGVEGVGRGYTGPGNLANPFDYMQMPGLWLDPLTGHLLVEESEWLERCDDKYQKNGDPASPSATTRYLTQTCYIAVTVDVIVTCPDGVMLRTPVDFWVEILRWKPSALIGSPVQKGPMAMTSPFNPHMLDCGLGTQEIALGFMDSAGGMLNMATEARVLGGPPGPGIMLNQTTGRFELEAMCSQVGLYMLCVEGWVGILSFEAGTSMIHSVTANPDASTPMYLAVKSRTVGCYYVEILDLPGPFTTTPAFNATNMTNGTMETTPGVMGPTTAAAESLNNSLMDPTTAPEIMNTPAPETPAPLLQPEVQTSVHVLRSQGVLEPIEPQIRMGYLNVQFEKDVDLIPYSRNLQLSAAVGVCAGDRDGGVQREIIESWNMHRNGMGDYDSKYRGVFFEMGPEEAGTTYTMGSKTYIWDCVKPWRYDLLKRRDAMERATVPYDCIYCWSEQM